MTYCLQTPRKNRCAECRLNDVTMIVARRDPATGKGGFAIRCCDACGSIQAAVAPERTTVTRLALEVAA